MMALRHLILMASSLVLVAALNPVPHQANEESLRGALNAVTRKQRSLNTSPQDYYLDLPNLRLREATDAKGKLHRDQVDVDGIDAISNDDDDDDGLTFIAPDGTGQLETIGDGYQHLSNRQYLNKALMDYSQHGADQLADNSGTRSVFRERERTGSRKRANSRRDLVLLDFPENEETERTLIAFPNTYENEPLIERYNQLQLLNRLLDQERENNRMLSVERRNVNARYPLFNQEDSYSNYMAKRRPMTKRSTKERQANLQVDPKVAQDLRSLFGNDKVNHSQGHEHQAEHTHSSVNNNPKLEGLAKLDNKTKERSTIEVRKKSVDWSQYFGIDRRKKKKAFYAGKPGQAGDQDNNEYLLQKYYEIMAEHLKPNNVKNAGEKRADELQQMDSELRDMKNLMIEEAVQVSSRNDMDSQQVKDEIMSRLATAYSWEKLRRALNELSSSNSNGAAIQHQENSPVGQVNVAADNLNVSKNIEDKRNSLQLRYEESFQGGKNCPQLLMIEARCRANEAFIRGFKEALHIPCIMYHMCSSCGEDDCLERFALEADKICEQMDEEDEEDEPNGLSLLSKRRCIENALLVARPRLESSTALSICHSKGCLALYQKHYAHSYAYDSPYATFSRDRRSFAGMRR